MRALVAIPVFNEQRYVRRVLERVLHFAPHVLVVDDGSTDQTPHILPDFPVDVIRHARNRGYGRSLRDAFRWSIANQFDWLITMDCDEQHEPESIPAFLAAAEEADLPNAIERGVYADIISGSRYLRSEDAAAMPENRAGENGVGENGVGENRADDAAPADRRAINRAITAELNCRLGDHLGIRMTDAFCGFKAYRVEALRLLRPTVSGYAFPMQFWVQAAGARLAVRELPVPRIYNDPNRSFGATLDDPTARLAHYRDIMHRELRRLATHLPAESQVGLGHAACTAAGRDAGACEISTRVHAAREHSDRSRCC